MNASNARPNLSARRGSDPVLTRVNVEGTVHATLARIRMSQEYRNDSESNVEIVYTFPLPLGSTLLDVVATLNGKQYRGQVVEKGKAERRYEEALDTGNTALMVARPEPGLYVMNLGNLMSRESVIIDIELATLVDWRGPHARLSLPMTLAPRYGEEAAPALAPHEKPVHGAGVERGFSLTLDLAGELARATIASPTHPIATRVDAGGARVTLQRASAWMDRDFVLTLEAAAPPAPAFVTVTHGGEAFTYASFQIPSRDHTMTARNVKVVIDCSGSMEGESIWLARAGVAQLLSRLRPRDRFGIVAFGSAAQSYSPCLLEASEWNLEAAQAWVRGLAADMGGTEMRAALDATFSVTGPPGESDVFLITDGQVADTGELVAAVAHTGHRIFVVAVGMAAQQEVLRQLADSSGGAMENVSPGEDIADAVRRVFARLVEAPVRALRVVKEAFEWEARTPATIFSGDTIHLFGAATRMPDALTVEWESGDGTPQHLQLARAGGPMADVAPIARIGAALRIQDLARAGEELAATNLAVRHQLVSAQTNYILTIDRGAARAPALPELRQVEHMVLSASSNFATFSAGESIGDLLSSLDDDEHPDPDEVRPLPDMPAFAAFLAAAGAAAEKGGLLARTFAELAALGAPQEMIAALRRLVARGGASEEEVVRGFWLVMLSKAAAFGLRPALRQLLDSEKMRLRMDMNVAGDILTLFRKTRVARPVA